jgi:hypothetical protein
MLCLSKQMGRLASQAFLKKSQPLSVLKYCFACKIYSIQLRLFLYLSLLIPSMRELSPILPKKKDNGLSLTKPLPTLKPIKLQSRLRVQSPESLLSYIQKKAKLWELENLCSMLIQMVRNLLALLKLQQKKLQKLIHRKLKINQKLLSLPNKLPKQQINQRKHLKLALLQLLQFHLGKEYKLVKLCQDFVKEFLNV